MIRNLHPFTSGKGIISTLSELGHQVNHVHNISAPPINYLYLSFLSPLKSHQQLIQNRIFPIHRNSFREILSIQKVSLYRSHPVNYKGCSV